MDKEIDLTALTGRPLCRLPVRAREEYQATTWCSSLVALCGGDPTVDPRSGGLIGIEAIADALARSVAHTRLVLKKDPDAAFVHWIDDLPITNVTSVHALRDALYASDGRRTKRINPGETLFETRGFGKKTK